MKDAYDELSRTDVEPIAATVDRRNFLKLAGFSFAGAALAGCERTPVEKAIPFLIRPEEIVPGKASWYASTCSGCTAGCGILVKHREGRPIKVEGNPGHPLSKGGVCVVGQALLLGLYDSHRLQKPKLNGKPSSWADVDAFVTNALANLRTERRAVRFLTGTIISPAVKASIDAFLKGFPDSRHVQWDPVSFSAILDAHARTHSARVLPRYDLSRAEVIVGFEADFLGAWISPVEHTKGYTAGRSLRAGATYSRHFQFESQLSVTGAKADERYGMTPAQVRWCLGQLERMITAGTSDIALTDIHPGVRSAADRLLAARGRSLVVCGINRLNEQLMVNRINQLLGNYGSTIDIARPSKQHQSDDRALLTLLEEMERGETGALFIAEADPLADLPNASRVAELLTRIPLVVSFAERDDETTALSTIVCAVPHAQECWSDAEPYEGLFSVAQPAFSPLGDTRPMIESLEAWTGRTGSAMNIVREHWRTAVHPRAGGAVSFDTFWDRAVHDGYAEVSPRTVAVRYAGTGPGTLPPEPPKPSLSLLVYQKTTMPHGRHAQNAWLQEVPEPITKLSWDNAALLSPETARQHGISSGDVVRLSTTGEGPSLEIPAWIQPGHPDNVVAVALGYGRAGTERFANAGPQWFEGKQTIEQGKRVGVNAASFISLIGSHVGYAHDALQIERTGRSVLLACSQPYPSLDLPDLGSDGHVERRPLIQETTLAAYLADPAAGSAPKHLSMSMWPEEHAYNGHHWGMAIDINACTGCSACVVSCQAENNIPVVGKDEIRRNRDMHWMRIDRYISGDDKAPEVVFQPMLCHQCDNAPCETVCPVEATVHSSEGLNQQVYNRCVGTRYCANNCPYKIRRFNWFNYPHEDQTENMILNPDVVVRTRGVMEKCSFCVQRIQESKIEAKRTGIPLSDATLKSACQQSCPADAIVFGDMNDPKSSVALAISDPRHYRLLEELEVRPSVGYMTIVRNRTGNEG